MKNRYFPDHPLLIFFLSALVFFNSCKDKDDNNLPEQDYRVVHWSSSDNGALIRVYSMDYEGEKVTRVMFYDYEIDADTNEIIIEYPDENSVVMTTNRLIPGGWQPTQKSEMTLHEGKTTRYVTFNYYGAEWRTNQKYELLYAGDNLVEKIWYLNLDGAWVPYEKYTYEYEGNKLARLFLFFYQEEEWKQHFRLERTYNGDILVRIIVSYTYGGNDLEGSMLEFYYDGGYLVEIKWFENISGMWIAPDEPLTITYDSHGNVETWTDPDNQYMGNAQFLYEEGKGNFSQLFFNNPAIVHPYLPFPTKK